MSRHSRWPASLVAGALLLAGAAVAQTPQAGPPAPGAAPAADPNRPAESQLPPSYRRSGAPKVYTPPAGAEPQPSLPAQGMVTQPQGMVAQPPGYGQPVLCTLVPVALFWCVISRENRSVQDLLLRTSVIHDWPVRRELGPTDVGSRSDL